MTKKIIRAVLNSLGYSLTDVKLTFKGKYIQDLTIKEDLKGTLQDICSHGLVAGFSGFTYYSDTTKFFDRNKQDIIQIIEEMTDGMGYSLTDTDALEEDADMKQVKRFLFNNFSCDAVACILSFNGFKNVGCLTQMKNLLTWASVEHVAYEMIAITENRD